MSVLDVIIGVLVFLVAIIVTAVVLLQQGHRAGINGAISGAADTFLSKTKARTADATLARITKFIAIAFFVLVLVANVVSAF